MKRIYIMLYGTRSFTRLLLALITLGSSSGKSAQVVILVQTRGFAELLELALLDDKLVGRALLYQPSFVHHKDLAARHDRLCISSAFIWEVFGDLREDGGQ